MKGMPGRWEAGGAGLLGSALLLVSAVAGAGCAPQAGGEAPASDLPEATPLEASGFSRLTSHEELVEFLEAVAEASPRATLRELGISVEGRRIPYLEVGLGAFGQDRAGKTLVLAFAQQHGNEPSGKEAALQLALELARGDHDALLEGWTSFWSPR